MSILIQRMPNHQIKVRIWCIKFQNYNIFNGHCLWKIKALEVKWCGMMYMYFYIKSIDLISVDHTCVFPSSSIYGIWKTQLWSTLYLFIQHWSTQLQKKCYEMKLSSDINLKWSIQKKERHGINSPAHYSLDFAFPMSMKGLGRGYSPMCLLKSAMSSTTQGCKR